MNTNLAIQRTPELIAAEINNIKNQTKTMLLYNSIEIGRRLTEAKLCLPHGEWGKWLEESVEYSKSTANNLMRIFEEYGADQLALFGETGAKSQALGSLNYSQAVALLAVPEYEREQFVEENDAENLSTRELQKLIKERDQSREDKEKAEADTKALQDRLDKEQEVSKQYLEEAARIKEELAQAQAAGNETEINNLKQELAEADEMLKCANEEIDTLRQEIKAKPIDVPATVETIPPEVEAELAELRSKNKSTAELKFKLQFETLKTNFNELLTRLS